MACSSPNFPHPVNTTAPRISIPDPRAAEAGAPAKTRIEPPKTRKMPWPKPGQYSEAKKRTSRSVYRKFIIGLDTVFYDSLRGPPRKSQGLQPGRRRRAAQARVRLLRLRAQGPGRSEERRVGKECRSRWS